jgi:hypothetical protein
VTEPIDPFSDTLACAIGLHELMMSYIEAGFTRSQAYGLVSAVMVASVRNGQR